MRIASLTAEVFSLQEILENTGNVILIAPTTKDLAEIK